MRQLGAGAVHPARQREDLPPAFQRILRGAQRPGAARSLRDQHAQRHARDDPVAVQEAVFRRRDARRILADHAAAALDDLAHQRHVFGGIRLVQCAAQNSDGAPARVKRAAVCAGVDAQRHAGDDAHARPGQLAREPARLRAAVVARAARAHDGERERIVERCAAADKKQVRRVRDVAQQRRVFRRIAQDELHPLRRQRIEQAVGRAGAQHAPHGCNARLAQLRKERHRIGEHLRHALRRAQGHLPPPVAHAGRRAEHSHGLLFPHAITSVPIFSHYTRMTALVNRRKKTGCARCTVFHHFL